MHCAIISRKNHLLGQNRKLSLVIFAIFAIANSLLIIKAHAQALFVNPVIFNDTQHLPRESNQGEMFDVLGNVVKLRTYTNHQDVKKIETKFSIYNQLSRTDDISFKVDGFELNGMQYPLDTKKMQISRFDPLKRTIIMIAGYMSDDHQKQPWLEHMKDSWLLLEDTNVILVSWAANNRFIYDRAVANTPFVARQISIFLHYLAQLFGTNLHDFDFLKRIHMVGHSLGSHISGFVGKDLAGKLGRISALDPAGPSFDKFGPAKRLHYTDALLVEAFHTNAGRMRYLNAIGSTILKGIDMVAKTVPGTSMIANAIQSQYSGEGDTAWFGIEDQVGHVDYYVNDGRVQPGCNGLLHVCDHGRSYEIFQSFLNYELMIAKQRLARSREDRFMAFKSPEFSDFNTGYNFRLKCPSLLAGSVAWAGDTRKPETFKNCSVPIDLLSDIDKLRQELSNEYGINMSNGTANSKYFFRTRHEEPFLGDHYLLKLHMAREPIWSDYCMFKADIHTHSGQKTTIKLNKQFDIINKKHSSILKDFQGVAIPFIHPNGPVSHNDLNDIFIQLDKINSPNSATNTTDLNMTSNKLQVDENLRYKINLHIPKSIDLYITNAEATGVKEIFSRLFRWTSGMCEFDITSIEIQPITPNSHAFITFYDAKNINTNDLIIRAYPRTQLVEELKNRYIKNNEILVYRLVRNGHLSLNATDLFLA